MRVLGLSVVDRRWLTMGLQLADDWSHFGVGSYHLIPARIPRFEEAPNRGTVRF